MVYVHLIEDVPASAADVWHVLGTNFASTRGWSTKYTESRPILNDNEIPKQFLPTHQSMHYNAQDVRRSSRVRGRIVPNPFHGGRDDGSQGNGGVAGATKELIDEGMQERVTFVSSG